MALAAVLAFAGFAALGTWQIERRAWKLALIARVEQRVHAPPMAAPGPDRWTRVNAADDEYRHIQASGRYLRAADSFVQAVTERGAGFWLMTPLRQTDGSVVLVNRGFVASDRSAPTTGEAAAPVTVTGLLRITEPGGGFLRHNDPTANRWYSRDVQAIAAARGLGPVAPYFIDADATPGDNGAGPVGGLTVISFHNNHLVYAITWYVLAVMVAAAAWHVARTERKGGDVGHTP